LNPRTPAGIAPEAIAFDRTWQPSQSLWCIKEKFYCVLFSAYDTINLMSCFDHDSESCAFDRTWQPPHEGVMTAASGAMPSGHAACSRPGQIQPSLARQQLLL
jgi:hypothetical protein